MAVIVQEKDRIMIYSKGADDYYQGRICASDLANYQDILDFSGKMARKGQRTLAFCGREVSAS
jgi:hypothetical protein